MKLTYIKQTGEPVGDGGDQYTGLDRFGRVVDQRWPQGEAELERVDYGFTAASNRQWRQNLVASGGQDEYYNYDGLYQVVELNRGTLNGGKTAISGTAAWTEDFTYDPIGNWNNYLTKVSGVTDLDQTRTHNTANETTEIDESTDTVAHDLAGNMVKVPQVADWEATNELKWDAWNRLVEVADGETIIAEYRYDGSFRRITKETDVTRHYYYSASWQIVEERLDVESTAERQFVWGQRYLDDLVLRDRDVDDDGSLDERLYVLSDYFNPTAIADEDGVVVERYGYNAFGLSRVMDAEFEPRSTSDFDWETRYGAYRWDGETGFYQVRYRYLHPTLGRWLSRDPIAEIGGLNIFVYTTNSPSNAVDTLGLEECKLGDKRSQKCAVTVTDSGNDPNRIKSVKSIQSLAGQTDEFFKVLGYIEGPLKAGKNIAEIIQEITIAYGKDKLSPDVEEMAKMAIALLKSLGDWRGYTPFTRIEYEECVCGFFSFNSNKFVDKSDPWKKVSGQGQLGLGTYEDRLSAIKAGWRACEGELEAWERKNIRTEKEDKPVE